MSSRSDLAASYLLLGAFFGFAVRVFGCAMSCLVVPRDIWLCHDSFWLCCELFGFAVRYLVEP